MNGNSAKVELRRRFRAARRALDPAARAAATSASLETIQEFITRRHPPALASYAAAGGELDLDQLHQQRWQRGEPVWLPRVRGDDLTWHPLTSSQALVSGAFGIREPSTEVPAMALPAGTLVLVPGVAFATNGHRLGQGRGYYDRALAGRDIISIGVGFACQRCDFLPIESHDLRLDGLILDGEWLRTPTLAP